jgi:hypothetical protein
MSGMTTLLPVSLSALSGAAKPLAPVKKSSADSGLHDDAARHGDRRQSTSRSAPTQGLSHSETEGASRWYGPRLAAPFVAQILGQVLPHSPSDPMTARTAYRSAPTRIPTGICFDSEV